MFIDRGTAEFARRVEGEGRTSGSYWLLPRCLGPMARSSRQGGAGWDGSRLISAQHPAGPAHAQPMPSPQAAPLRPALRDPSELNRRLLVWRIIAAGGRGDAGRACCTRGVAGLRVFAVTDWRRGLASRRSTLRDCQLGRFPLHRAAAATHCQLLSESLALFSSIASIDSQTVAIVGNMV